VAKPDSPFREVNIFKEVNNAGGAVVSPCREEWRSEGDRIYYILMMAYYKERSKKLKEWKDRKRFAT
jgi:hypothetical protein